MTILSPTSHSQSGETKEAGPTGTDGPTKTKIKKGLTVGTKSVYLKYGGGFTLLPVLRLSYVNPMRL